MVFENFAKSVKSKFKLPSKPWLIFIGCTGSLASAIIYDKQQKKKIQNRLIQQVSYLADRPLPTDTYPRKVMICMAPPMGSSTRKLRAHFEEYIEPIFNSAALDYELIESRIEGGVRRKVINLVHKRKQEEENPSYVALPMDIPGKPRYSLSEDLIAFGRASYREMLEGLNQGFLSLHPKEYIKDINKIEAPKKKKQEEIKKPVTEPKDKKKEGLFSRIFKRNEKKTSISDTSSVNTISNNSAVSSSSASSSSSETLTTLENENNNNNNINHNVNSNNNVDKDNNNNSSSNNNNNIKNENENENENELKFSEDYLPDFPIEPIVGEIPFINLVGKKNIGKRINSWFHERRLAQFYGEHAVAIAVGKHVPFSESRDIRLGLFEERQVAGRKFGPLPKMYRIHDIILKNLRIIQDFGVPDEQDTERRVDQPLKGKVLVGAFGAMGETPKMI